MMRSSALDQIAADGVRQIQAELAETLPLVHAVRERVRRLEAIQRDTARRLGGRRLGSYLNVIGYAAIAAVLSRAINEQFIVNLSRLVADVERREQEPRS